MGRNGQMQQVLIVSGEERHAETLASAIRHSGRNSNRCRNLDEAASLLARDRYTAVLCEDAVSGGNVASLVSQIAGASRHMPVIVVSRNDDWEHYLAALAAGASGYLAFPPYPGEVEHSLETAANLRAEMASAA